MATKKETVVEILPIDIRMAEITVIGDTPLIMHKWSEKAKREMLEKQMKVAKTKGKDAKSPVADFIDRFGKDAKVVIDPVMADNGVLYKGFTEEFAHSMAKLCGKADLIIPNLTEASFMLDIPYNPNYDEAYIKDVLKKLTALGAKCAALTGIGFKDDEIGVYCYDSEKDLYYHYFNEKLPAAFHGTGDIYASATVGAMMRGFDVFESLSIAVDFTLKCMKKTLEDKNHRFYGVNFEEALPYYIKRLGIEE